MRNHLHKEDFQESMFKGDLFSKVTKARGEIYSQKITNARQESRLHRLLHRLLQLMDFNAFVAQLRLILMLLLLLLLLLLSLSLPHDANVQNWKQ